VSREAEQALLGAILLKPEIFRRTKVVEDDFSDPRDRRIFKAMGQLDAEGRPAGDMALLAETLKDKETIIYLNSLADQVGTTASWEHYDQLVREASVKRQFGNLARRIGQQVKNGAAPAEIIETSQEEIRRLNERLSGERKSLHQQIRDWLDGCSGKFNTQDIYRFFSLNDTTRKKAALMALGRLEKDGIIRRVAGGKAGWYAKVEEKDFALIDYENADDTPLDIILPFGLHRHMEWFAKGMGVIAGDQDAGKTALMFNLAHDNQGLFSEVVYIATEMGPPLLKRRLKKFCFANDYLYPDAIRGISFREPKTINYMDLIEPDAFNIIDYYELSGEQFKEVSGYFRQIYDRLNKGVCFIALQKKRGADLGRSAELALEKPLLYISLHRGGIGRIEKCKTEWTEDFRPYDIEYHYKIVGGGKLTWEKQTRAKR